ncbi:muts domain V-domain-containing protein [Mucor mucedo]|uniref:muts domain V-domain-containing protein n=1 Tax=Mucor mucedo TaxID=29922 RepID=UPI00221F5376|nr:muts domain V-domain-containing protein [Mucor mucedo]KAI7895639.1 muts domain V-domain-containing protein [Mucor mucedo]
MSTLAETEDIPEIENSEKQGFASFYKNLDIAEAGTLRMFERDANNSTYFTFHEDDARYVAEVVYQTPSVIKNWGGLATTKLTETAAKGFLRDLLINKQKRIQIWTGSRTTWRISREASPGNLQQVEDFLFSSVEMTSAPVVIAVKYSNKSGTNTVGVSFADTTINQLGLSEFTDNDSYSNLESLIVQLGVRECILLAKGAEEKDFDRLKIQNILARCDVTVTERPNSHFNAKNIEQDLNRLLEGDVNVQALPEFELADALSSCACIIHYLQLLSNDSNFGKFTLKNHDLSQYMRLDGSALTALNLLPTAEDGPRKSTSVYGLLNKCKTAQGSRLFAQWLKQPLLSLHEITQRQDLVQAFVNNTMLRQTLQEVHLNRLPDLHRMTKKFLKGNAKLQDVVRIYQVVIRLPQLIDCLMNGVDSDENLYNLVKDTFTTKIEKTYGSLANLEQLVVTTIDLEAVDRHEYIIKAEYNEELKDIHTNMSVVLNQMEEVHDRMCSTLSLEKDKKVKLEIHATYGYCFRVLGRTEASKVRNKSEYFELATQKSGTFFTSSALKGLSKTYSQLSSSYNEKQKGLEKEVLEIVATYCPDLESLGSVLAHMDVLVSFAHVSAMSSIPYVRPTLTPCGQGNVMLENARHPCLETQDYVTFIPNDVEMIRGSTEFKIVTGPNMGGKSTYIRQVGVIALMAQIGCFVPCSSATLCIFDSILARVGASDSQLKGVSTFMAEMLETATILKSATQNSLVIIDELGRGTSTSDGIGLAWAISEYIATEIRSFCLFATHFHELTTLAEKFTHVDNLHVAVHIGEGTNVTLLYKVNRGVGDKSFGIHVAGLANFPEMAINLAKRKAIELDEELDIVRGIEAHDSEEVRQGKAIWAHIMDELALNDSEQHFREVKEKYWAQIRGNAYLNDLLGDAQ